MRLTFTLAFAAALSAAIPAFCSPGQGSDTELLARAVVDLLERSPEPASLSRRTWSSRRGLERRLMLAPQDSQGFGWKNDEDPLDRYDDNDDSEDDEGHVHFEGCGCWESQPDVDLEDPSQETFGTTTGITGLHLPPGFKKPRYGLAAAGRLAHM